MRSWSILLCLLVLCVEVAAATAVTLEGERIDGDELTLLPGARLRIDQRELALADLDWIARRAVDPAPWDRQVVLLADGSWLPAASLRRGGADAVVAATTLGELELPLGTVIGWGTGDWLQQAAALRAQGDLVQVGNERYRGSVLALGEDGLLMDVAEVGEVRLPLERIQGLRLAIPAEPPEGLVLAVPLIAGRPPALLRAADGGLHLAAAPHLELASLPPGRLQIQGGRRVWLSDLDPSEVSERGAFGVTWGHGRDANLEGGPISLRGHRYQHGLVVHSEAELVWDLDGAYQALVAEVGIDDLVGAEGDCSLRVLVDGEERWARESIRGGEPPEALHVALAGARQLRIVVGFGARYDIGDHLALAGAYLVRAAE